MKLERFVGSTLPEAVIELLSLKAFAFAFLRKDEFSGCVATNVRPEFLCMNTRETLLNLAELLKSRTKLLLT